MESHTIFYIAGAVLAVLAVSISFLGIRSKDFPPEGPVSRVILGVFAALVVFSAAYAIITARDEQAERREHLAEAAHGEEAEEVDTGEAAGEKLPASEQSEEESETEDEGGDELETQGAQVFADNGCGSCHALSAASATGALGPDLDLTLQGQEAAEIEESIVNPDAKIVDGFDAGIMPGTYGEEIAPEDLEALVAYLEFAVSQATS